MSRLRRCAVNIVGVGVLAAVLAGLRLAQYVHAPWPGEGLQVTVPAGAGAAQVAHSLARAGIGNWPLGTRLGLRLWGAPRGLKAGTYRFDGRYSLQRVFADLAAGRVEQVSVTLPEGLTARQMAELLEQRGVVSAAQFTAQAYAPDAAERWGVPGPTLEGYLFPDTYRFARGQTGADVIAVLLGRFQEVAAEFAAQREERGLSVREWVTLASMVEKETGTAQERELVAAVFVNRLARNMRLESDPTVIYGLDGFDGNLRRRDLRTDTPYNTYTRRGLPLGPIASPGRASLAAALHPAQVPYLYFVSRNDGSHVFSVTYAEHAAAVRRYQGGPGR